MIQTWNSNRQVIVNSVAASAAIEMRAAGLKKKFPKLHRITADDPRVRQYKMKLTDARPAINEDTLDASGRAWWEGKQFFGLVLLYLMIFTDYIIHSTDEGSKGTASPEPATPGTLRSGRLRDMTADVATSRDNVQEEHRPGETNTPATRGRRAQKTAVDRSQSPKELPEGGSQVKKGQQPVERHTPPVPAGDDVMDTGTYLSYVFNGPN